MFIRGQGSGGNGGERRGKSEGARVKGTRRRGKGQGEGGRAKGQGLTPNNPPKPSHMSCFNIPNPCSLKNMH